MLNDLQANSFHQFVNFVPVSILFTILVKRVQYPLDNDEQERSRKRVFLVVIDAAKKKNTALCRVELLFEFISHAIKNFFSEAAFAFLIEVVSREGISHFFHVALNFLSSKLSAKLLPLHTQTV
jgi:hypothetical protein